MRSDLPTGSIQWLTQRSEAWIETAIALQSEPSGSDDMSEELFMRNVASRAVRLAFLAWRAAEREVNTAITMKEEQQHGRNEE